MKRYSVVSFTYEKVKYKYLLYKHGTSFAIAMQRKVPAPLKNLPSLFGMYSYYSLAHELGLSTQEGSITVDEIKVTDVGSPIFRLLHGDLVYKKHVSTYNYYLSYTLKPVTNKYKTLESYIHYFGNNNTVFIYNSIQRNRIDLLVLFIYMVNTYNTSLRNFIAHIPDDYDYKTSLNNHRYMGFKKMSSYRNHNSGNVVYVLKKSLVHEK